MKAIAVDFDGCICTNAFPNIGTPNWSVIDKAIAEQAAGAGLILWTCREGELLQQALDACAQWGLHFDAVNESLPSWIAAFGTRPRKVGASEYWDDRAVVVRDGEVQLLKTRDIYTAAVKKCGKEHQLVLCMEEMAELTKELSKNMRGFKNTTNISEEMADVEIMLEQLRIIYGNRSEVDTIKAEKLLRLSERLEVLCR